MFWHDWTYACIYINLRLYVLFLYESIAYDSEQIFLSITVDQAHWLLINFRVLWLKFIDLDRNINKIIEHVKKKNQRYYNYDRAVFKFFFQYFQCIPFTHQILLQLLNDFVYYFFSFQNQITLSTFKCCLLTLFHRGFNSHLHCAIVEKITG